MFFGLKNFPKKRADSPDFRLRNLVIAFTTPKKERLEMEYKEKSISETKSTIGLGVTIFLIFLFISYFYLDFIKSKF
jgi:hypothetical protein